MKSRNSYIFRPAQKFCVCDMRGKKSFRLWHLAGERVSRGSHQELFGRFQVPPHVRNEKICNFFFFFLRRRDVDISAMSATQLLLTGIILFKF